MIYNGVNSYIFVNGVEISKLKVKDSETNAALLCLGNVSKDFSVDSMKRAGLFRYIYDFSVDYHGIDVKHVLDIDKYVIKKHDIKCLDLLKKVY